LAFPSRRRRRRALVGSAVAISDRSDKDKGYGERRGLEWQQRALRVVDLVPELDYVSRFYAKMLSPLRLYPAKIKSDGQPQEIKTGLPIDVLSRIRDPGGGQSQFLASYGRLMLITGEGNLFGYNLDTDDERWIFIWNDELKVEKNKSGEVSKYIWTPISTSNPQEFTTEQASAYKFWTPHPRRSGESTSPMRAIVEGDIAEELIALTRSVRATAVSRATQGILIIPQEITPPPEGDDENPEENSWLVGIAEHLEAQIENAGSAAAAAPYIMDPPFEYAEGIRIVDIHKTEHDYLEKELRKEAVERIARGIDFPAEALLGIGQTNHWAALQILMDMWRSHGAPMARQLCSDLTSAYFQPALREEGFTAWEETVVAFDASEVTVKPDRSDDAKAALRMNAIGPSGFRKMLGIPDEFAPTPEELLAQSNGRPKQPEREPRDVVADGPEQPGPEGDSGRRTRATASVERKMGIIELGLMRCRELAGIRIKQKAQRHHQEQLAFIEETPLADVAASLGQELVKSMGFTSSVALVSGGADQLRSLLCVWGHSKEQADIFAQGVEMHAAHMLFEPGFPTMDGHLQSLANGLGVAA
jgi:hypothetical protein